MQEEYEPERPSHIQASKGMVSVMLGMGRNEHRPTVGCQYKGS